MVMPAIHPWASKRGLSTSVHHVLCQALGRSREQSKEVLPKEEGAKKGPHAEIREKSITGRGHSKPKQEEDLCPWNKRPTKWS